MTADARSGTACLRRPISGLLVVEWLRLRRTWRSRLFAAVFGAAVVLLTDLGEPLRQPIGSMPVAFHFAPLMLTLLFATFEPASVLRLPEPVRRSKVTPAAYLFVQWMAAMLNGLLFASILLVKMVMGGKPNLVNAASFLVSYGSWWLLVVAGAILTPRRVSTEGPWVKTWRWLRRVVLWATLVAGLALPLGPPLEVLSHLVPWMGILTVLRFIAESSTTPWTLVVTILIETAALTAVGVKRYRRFLYMSGS